MGENRKEEKKVDAFFVGVAVHYSHPIEECK